MKKTKKGKINPILKVFLIIAVVLFIFSILVGLILLALKGYNVDWTGFESKLLWDWLDLVILPVLLLITVAIINWGFRRNEKASKANLDLRKRAVKDELKLIKEKNQNEILQDYLNYIGELVKNGGFSDTSKDLEKTKTAARIRTLAAFKALNGKRKSLIVSYLHDADLISKNSPKIDLRLADLKGANLKKFNLVNTNFNETNFKRAKMKGINLTGSNLLSTNLRKADLRGATLEKTDFSGSDLRRAKLRGANFSEAVLNDVDLYKADYENEIFVAKTLNNALLKNGDKYVS